MKTILTSIAASSLVLSEDARRLLRGRLGVCGHKHNWGGRCVPYRGTASYASASTSGMTRSGAVSTIGSAGR